MDEMSSQVRSFLIAFVMAGIVIMLIGAGSGVILGGKFDPASDKAPSWVMPELERLDGRVDAAYRHFLAHQPEDEETYYEQWWWFADARRYLSDMKWYVRHGRDRSTLDRAWLARVKRSTAELLPPSTRRAYHHR